MALLHHLTMADILARIIAAFLFAGLAGGLTTGFMWLFGDKDQRHSGRLSFSPFAHVTLSGIFLAIAFRSSWFAPLPQTRQPHGPKAVGRSIAPALAVFAAMAVMLALVPLLDLLRSPLHAALPMTMGYAVLFEIETLQRVITGSVMLGLLPLPGMWLGNAVPALLPELAKRYRKSTGLGLSAAAILLILGWYPDSSALLALLRLV